MTKTFPLFVALLLFAGIWQPAAAQTRKKGWKLVWQDEFRYKGLPNPKKWGYEVGHIRNQEKQYYTDARKENVWVQDGVLTITGRKETYPNAAYVPNSEDWKKQDAVAQYTSASINTLGRASWKYGRVEVRAKLPQGGGIWPAIWMMGVNRSEVGWPYCGEIDVLEFIGSQPGQIHGTVHYPGTPPHRSTSNGGKTTGENLHTEFHVYAMEWDEEKITIFFDDQPYHTFSLDAAGEGADNPFRKPFYLLINLAMGADWPGPVDDKVLPQQYVVDYVRVYQKR